MSTAATIRDWFKSSFKRRSSKCPSPLPAEVENTQTSTVSDEELQLPQFTETEKQLIRKSWKELQSEIYHVGVVSFINLFEHKMEFRRSFAQFRHMSKEELRNSPLVKAHAMSILHVIEQLVNRLDDMTKWETIIIDLASRHAGRNVLPHVARDVADHCWKSIEPLLKKIQSEDEELEKIWLAIIRWLGATMEYHLMKV